jgi:hypothetical protein
VAKRYASNDHVIFDTNNEFHDEDNALVASLNQKAIDAIRGAGATSQYIFVEGNSWTGAWHWVSTLNPRIAFWHGGTLHYVGKGKEKTGLSKSCAHVTCPTDRLN